MRLFVTILLVLLSFVLGVFVENNFRVISHVQACCQRERCPCGDDCDCCPACPGKGGSGKCKCPDCDCCPSCPGAKRK